MQGRLIGHGNVLIALPLWVGAGVACVRRDVEPGERKRERERIVKLCSVRLWGCRYVRMANRGVGPLYGALPRRTVELSLPRSDLLVVCSSSERHPIPSQYIQAGSRAKSHQRSRLAHSPIFARGTLPYPGAPRRQPVQIPHNDPMRTSLIIRNSRAEISIRIPCAEWPPTPPHSGQKQILIHERTEFPRKSPDSIDEIVLR